MCHQLATTYDGGGCATGGVGRLSNWSVNITENVSATRAARHEVLLSRFAGGQRFCQPPFWVFLGVHIELPAGLVGRKINLLEGGSLNTVYRSVVSVEWAVEKKRQKIKATVQGTNQAFCFGAVGEVWFVCIGGANKNTHKKTGSKLSIFIDSILPLDPPTRSPRHR